MKIALTLSLTVVVLASAGIALILRDHLFLGIACLWLCATTVVLTWFSCAGALNKRLDREEEERALAERKGSKIDLYA